MHAPEFPARLQEISDWLESQPASQLSELHALQLLAAEDQAQEFPWRSYRHNRVVRSHLNLHVLWNRWQLR